LIIAQLKRKWQVQNRVWWNGVEKIVLPLCECGRAILCVVRHLMTRCQICHSWWTNIQTLPVS